MYAKFLIDHTPSTSTALEVPGFPWVRIDADRFIWEEALFDGNYLSVHHSAMGRCQSRENIYLTLTGSRYPAPMLYAFAVEMDGQLLRDRWEWKSEQIIERERGVQELIVELAYSSPSVSVRVHTRVDGSAFLERWLEIVNESDRPMALSRIFPWAGLIGSLEAGTQIRTRDAGSSYSLGRFRNHHWAMEGEFAWMPLPEGVYQEALQGNKYHPPMYIVRNERSGELTVLHLESTIDTEVTFTQGWMDSQEAPRTDAYLSARVGVSGTAPFRVLAPGETVSSPAVHVSMIYGDLDACVLALNAHLRASVLRPEIAHTSLVEYNHTGYTLNAQISRELLRREVEMAAAVGVELFLVDAGWFGSKEKSWAASIGDWKENPLLGEGGLRDTFAYARDKGMKCGLWMPPEWVSAGVPVHTEHPEWFIPGTLNLDLLNPEVEAHVFRSICTAVEQFELDCYRIDGGASDVGERVLPDGRIVNMSWPYYEVLYRIYERVAQRYPHLIMENCSGGGGRSDLAMMRRFHYTQITDNWQPEDQIRILNGMTLALPPEVCMPLVGSINMRPAELDFVIRTGMLGHFTVSGVFPNAARINPPSLERWQHGVALYKSFIRPLLPTCRVYHHTPVQDYLLAADWVVLEYAAANADAAVVGLFRCSGSRTDTFTLIARGLDPARDYLVTRDNTGDTLRLPGHLLCAAGLPVRLAGVMMSELLIIRAIRE